MQDADYGGDGLVQWSARGQRGIVVLSLMFAASVISGCALPGYNSGSLDNDAWYDFGGNQQATYDQALANQREIDYEPVVLSITPALIRHQNQQRVSQELGEAQQELLSEPDVLAYKIGVGDILQVIVYGHPELNNPSSAASPASISSPLSAASRNSGSSGGQLVGADGKVYFPYAGDLQAAGLTPKELRKKLARSLSDYIRQPQVDVRVAAFRSQRVYISGDIPKPCTVPISDVTLTLLQALDQCDTLVRSASRGSRGGGQEGGGVGVQNVVLIRDGVSTPLDLNQVYATGRPVALQSGDRLLVDDSANRVFMVGEFTEQLALPYSTGGMALSDAIADAGGVNLGTADTSAIYVVRGFVDSEPAQDGGVKTTVRPKVFKLDAGAVSGLVLANQFQLQPRDVVFAAPASLVNFNRALALITPSLDILFRSFLIYDRASNRN